MTSLPPQAEKATAVREMFDRISSRYDRVNRWMTFNSDRRWRRDLVARLGVGPGDSVLDLACGTGDFTDICRDRGAFVCGLDFSRGMLVAASERAGRRDSLIQGDALHLPLAGESFSVAVSGFALRNFVAIPPVLHELARVLRRGGRLGLLEVDRPDNGLVRRGHSLYFNHAVPRIGRVLADGPAYRYLPDSVSYLPEQRELVRMLRDAGFTDIRKRTFMFGAVQAITTVRA